MPNLTPLDIHARIAGIIDSLGSSGYSRADARGELAVLVADIESRSVDTGQPLQLPCWWDAEGSGVIVEQGLSEDQATLSVWDGQNPDPDGDANHVGCILSPESAMHLGRWLCSWAGTRLTARTEVPRANS